MPAPPPDIVLYMYSWPPRLFVLAQLASRMPPPEVAVSLSVILPTREVIPHLCFCRMRRVGS